MVGQPKPCHVLFTYRHIMSYLLTKHTEKWLAIGQSYYRVIKMWENCLLHNMLFQFLFFFFFFQILVFYPEINFCRLFQLFMHNLLFKQSGEAFMISCIKQVGNYPATISLHSNKFNFFNLSCSQFPRCSCWQFTYTWAVSFFQRIRQQQHYSQESFI